MLDLDLFMMPVMREYADHDLCYGLGDGVALLFACLILNMSTVAFYLSLMTS